MSRSAQVPSSVISTGALSSRAGAGHQRRATSAAGPFAGSFAGARAVARCGSSPPARSRRSSSSTSIQATAVDELHGVVVYAVVLGRSRTRRRCAVWCSRAAARASRSNRRRWLVAGAIETRGSSAPRGGRARPARPRRPRPCRRGPARGGCDSRRAAPHPEAGPVGFPDRRTPRWRCARARPGRGRPRGSPRRAGVAVGVLLERRPLAGAVAVEELLGQLENPGRSRTAPRLDHEFGSAPAARPPGNASARLGFESWPDSPHRHRHPHPGAMRLPLPHALRPHP